MVQALSKEGAQREFARDNPHAVVVDSLLVSGDPSFVSNLSHRIHEQQAVACAKGAKEGTA